MFKVKIFNGVCEEETRHCSTFHAAQAVASNALRKYNNAEVRIYLGENILGVRNFYERDWIFPELSLVR